MESLPFQSHCSTTRAGDGTRTLPTHTTPALCDSCLAPWAVRGRAGLRGVAAVPLSTLHSCTTAAGAGGPGAPGAPGAVDGLRPESHGDTLAVEAPLWGQAGRGEHRVKDGAQHMDCPVEIPALLAWRCLGVSCALPEPGAPQAMGSSEVVLGCLRIWGGNKPKAPQRPPSAKGFIAQCQPRGLRGASPAVGEIPGRRIHEPCALRGH